MPGAVRLRLPVAGHGEPAQLIGRAVRHLLAHGAGKVEVVEPLARLAVVLKGIVDREHDAIIAEHRAGERELLVEEVAAGGVPDVLASCPPFSREVWPARRADP